MIERGLGHRLFGIEGPALRLDGSMGGRQRIEMIAWRESALIRELIRDPHRAGRDRTSIGNRLHQIERGERPDPIRYEHLGAFLDDGTPGEEPFWVPLLATGTLG